MLDDDDLDGGLTPDPDDEMPEDLLNDIIDDNGDGSGDDRSLVEKAKDKYDEIKNKVEDVKDKVEKGKEWAENVKKARDAKRAADATKDTIETAKKTKQAVDTTKNAVDAVKTAKTAADTAKAAKVAADTAKVAAQTTKAAGGIVKTAQAVVHGISTAAQAVAHAVTAFIESVIAFWYVYLIVLGVILLIIIIVAVVTAIGAFFNWKTDPDNMKTNSFITSEHFYGTRSVYIDEKDLITAMELDYKQFSIELIENIKLDNPEIVVNIQLPELANGQKLTNDIDLDDAIDQYMVKAIASIAATGSTGYTDTSFADLYSLIDVFGLTQEQLTMFKTHLSQYLESNSLLSGQSINIANIVEDAFTVDADGEHDLSYITNLCEKVMIKDEIAGKEGISDIRERRYIASIYMPKHDISITHAVYTINGKSGIFAKHFQLIEENNSNKIVHNEQTLSGEVNFATGIDLGKANIKQFTSINQDSPSDFSAGISLFEAVKRTPKTSQYFQQAEQELNGKTENIYTWKPTCDSLLYLTFSDNLNEPDKEASQNKFIFTEFDFWVSTQ